MSLARRLWDEPHFECRGIRLGRHRCAQLRRSAAGRPDCDTNGIPDACDIDCGGIGCSAFPACGGSLDCAINANGDGNGVPDECEYRADVNGDGLTTLSDFAAFQRALTGPGGRLAGGCTDTNCDITASAVRYETATGQWHPAGSMSTARRDHIAERLADGTVLVAGGWNAITAASVAASSSPLVGQG